MLTVLPAPRYPNQGLPPEALAPPSEFDWGARLSIDAIRQHTKTDDVPGVTDSQLAFYRSAAIEAAEHYTGRLLSGQRMVNEPVSTSSRARFGKYTYKHRLRYPVASGPVYLYGTGVTMKLTVSPGSHVIHVPYHTGMVDLSNCCDPCAVNAANSGMMATYLAGYACPAEVPAGIVLGMLQFIAWVVEHPGDEYFAVRNNLNASSPAIQGTSNIAAASGAIETWRQYDPEAV